jgi:asparagine synthase (glutamine-hydrolysing)
MGLICGILGRKDAALVKAMAAAMRHRGSPAHVHEGDDYSVASSDPGDGQCLLDGAPRDVSGLSLLPKEFLAHCREAIRPEDLKLRGAFAAAVRMEGRNSWWLLRDRLGRGPLYYYQGLGFLLFSSELKGLLASGQVPRKLNAYSVDRMLALGCVPGSGSILEGVCRVRPGHIAEYRNGRLQETPHAQFDFELRDLSREQAAQKLRTLLRQAVNRFETDDILWASGIDCAALAGLRQGANPLFVQLDRAWEDEAKLAKESARLLKLKLRVEPAVPLTANVFRKVAYHLDEPMADAAAIPLWQICQQAAEHGDQFLTGFGADELLGGYARFRFLQMSRGARAVVPMNLLSGLLPALPPNAFVRRGGQYLASIRDPREAYLALVSVFDRKERDELYSKQGRDALGERDAPLGIIDEYFTSDDITRNLLSLDLGVALPDLLLTRCDRMAAAHGLTLQHPYLDGDLVDFLVRLEPGVKFGVRSKPILRMALRGVLPGRVRLRARRGFKVPQSGRTFGVIESVARETLTRDRVMASGLFEWRRVEEVIHAASHNIYRRRQFWALLMFFAWYREFME